MDRQYYVALVEHSKYLHAGWRQVSDFDQALTDEDLSALDPYDEQLLKDRGFYFMERTLCGLQASQVMPNQAYESYVPQGHEEVCTECARRFSADQAPDIDGWTKTCDVCLVDKPVNKFFVSPDRPDGVSSICLECSIAAERLKRHRHCSTRTRTGTDGRGAELLLVATAQKMAMQAWQHSPVWPTLICECGKPYTAQVHEGSTPRAVLVCCRTHVPDERLLSMIEQSAQMSEFLELHLDVVDN